MISSVGQSPTETLVLGRRHGITKRPSAVPGQPYKVELVADWRALPPVMMEIGPVLHVDDVVAGKMSALFTRAQPRDFLDVDAAVVTGRYTQEQLLELAEQADAGFDRRILALLSVLERYPDRRFVAYGIDPVGIAAMREHFARRREQLVADEGSRGSGDLLVDQQVQPVACSGIARLHQRQPYHTRGRGLCPHPAAELRHHVRIARVAATLRGRLVAYANTGDPPGRTG
jgi:hypothetical protein